MERKCSPPSGGDIYDVGSAVNIAFEIVVPSSITNRNTYQTLRTCVFESLSPDIKRASRIPSRLRAHVPVSAGGAAWSQREGASPSTAYPDRNSWTADAAVGAVS